MFVTVCLYGELMESKIWFIFFPFSPAIFAFQFLRMAALPLFKGVEGRIALPVSVAL